VHVVAAQVSVTTWGYDNSRDLLNSNETTLTPSNVNSAQFGKLFSQTVDGYVYAQPLYLPNITIGGQAHNVVFVATEHDGVYAFDADGNGGGNASPLWYDSLFTTAFGAAAGATSIPQSEFYNTDIVPEVGITGTPVIDPVSGTLYVVSATLEGSTFVQRLHALSVTTGAEKFGGPVIINATVPGTGTGSADGELTFDSEWENQRPGLLLVNGIVYIGFAAHGDAGPWHGWIFGYNAQTLQQTGVFCISPNGVGSGVWLSGAGLSAEVNDPVNHPYGRMFVPTGNGDYDATTPYANGMDFGDSILNLDLTNGVPTVQDEFTPSTQASQDASDSDQASAGLLILPTQTSGSYPNLLVQSGKAGCIFLLNRSALGGYTPATPTPTNSALCAGDQVVQEIPYGTGGGTWTGPSYWNGTVYYWAQQAALSAFPLSNGLLGSIAATSSESYGYPGANPVISANGNTQGIVWTIDSEAYTSGGPAVLQAHNATRAGSALTTLYTSNGSSNSSRDNPGNAVKFTLPTVANGKVYVGAQYQISVFGLLDTEQTAAAPVISPGSETFNGSLSVSMSDTTSGAIIYYTTNGTTPIAGSSPVYTPGSPITITASTTIEAIASASGYLQSGVSSEAYVDSSQVATPVFTPAAGTYTQPQSVSIGDSTTGATIYYTTDGTNPATSPTAVKYTVPFTVSATDTVNAIAEASGFANSNEASATYTLNLGQTGIDFTLGFAGTQEGNPCTTNCLVFNGTTDLDDTRLQLTNGGTNEASSAWFYQPVNVQAFTTTFEFQLSNTVNGANGMTFTIQGENLAALGNSGSGLGYQGIPSSVAVKFDFYTPVGRGNDSTGLYISGAIPTTPAIDLSTTSINLLSDDPMIVQLTYNGSILSMLITDTVTGGTYSTSWTVNIPNLVGGNTAYVGFTGSTGGLVSSQKILNWTYTVGSAFPATLTSPTPGLSTVLGTTNVPFQWSSGTEVGLYQLNLSAIAPGDNELFSYKGTATSATVPGLPANGATVYARLYSYINGAWQHNDYVYTESGTPTPAGLTSPTPGLSTVLGTTNVPFQWTAGIGVSDYQLNLSAIAPGSNELYTYKGTATSTSVPALPADAVTVYATLYSKINGVWQSNSYEFTEGGTPTPATLTSPTPGISTILGTTNVPFQWTAGVGVNVYQLNLSAIAPGSNELYTYKGTATSTSAPTLPDNGVEVYARLYSKINGVWQYNDYVYTESGTPTPAVLTSPTPGLNTILGTSNVQFQWTAGIGVSEYQLNVSAVAAGDSDLYLYKGTTTAATAPSLPANGVKVYARLYSKINGTWQYNDYVYTEQ
jgi:hypothetical protein